MNDSTYYIVTLIVTAVSSGLLSFAAFQRGKKHGFLEGHDAGLQKGKRLHQHPMIRKYCERETSKN